MIRLGSDWRQLHQQLIAAGYTYGGLDGQGHHAYHRDGCRPVRLAATPVGGHTRSLSNARAAVRRAIREATS